MTSQTQVRAIDQPPELAQRTAVQYVVDHVATTETPPTCRYFDYGRDSLGVARYSSPSPADFTHGCSLKPDSGRHMQGER